MVRKVKILKKPKFDLTKLMELYKDSPEDAPKPKAPAAENAIKTADEWVVLAPIALAMTIPLPNRLAQSLK